MDRASAPRCSGTTRAGLPCRKRALPGTEPPACASHARPEIGPEPGGGTDSRSAGEVPLKHGFYSAALRPEELADLLHFADNYNLDDEIACARVSLRRVLDLITRAERRDGLTPEDYARMVGLALQASRTIARLLRDRRALSGEAADGISGAIAQALDELATEWGIDL